MKRFWAAVIDFVICYILSRIFFGWIWEILKRIHGADLQTLSRMMVRGMKFVVSFLTCFFYSILFDTCPRETRRGEIWQGAEF